MSATDIKHRDNIDKARMMYLTTDKSITEVARELDMSPSTLYKWCSKENWVMFKTSSNKVEVSGVVFEEICSSIGFYNKVKKAIDNLIEQTEDIHELKKCVETYKMAEERIKELMLFEEEDNQ